VGADPLRSAGPKSLRPRNGPPTTPNDPPGQELRSKRSVPPLSRRIARRAPGPLASGRERVPDRYRDRRDPQAQPAGRPQQDRRRSSARRSHRAPSARPSRRLRPTDRPFAERSRCATRAPSRNGGSGRSKPSADRSPCATDTCHPRAKGGRRQRRRDARRSGEGGLRRSGRSPALSHRHGGPAAVDWRAALLGVVSSRSETAINQPFRNTCLSSGRGPSSWRLAWLSSPQKLSAVSGSGCAGRMACFLSSPERADARQIVPVVRGVNESGLVARSACVEGEQAPRWCREERSDIRLGWCQRRVDGDAGQSAQGVARGLAVGGPSTSNFGAGADACVASAPKSDRERSYGRVSRTRLKGVSAARRNRVKPPAVTTSRRRVSPA
jgi:hypothetical protein